MTSVKLRQATTGDADWIFDACQDREIQRWTQVPRPYTRAHAAEFVGSPGTEFARWVVESVASGEPVGLMSIHEIESGCASIGYWIVPQHRGRGFTTEAICLVCDEIERLRSESSIEVDMVRAFIARDNTASRRAVEKAGFEVVEEQLGPAIEDLVVAQTCVYSKRL